jgi:uncharacterized protein (DUF1015 family)
MSLKLYPFPTFHHPPFGSVLGSLPATRDGVRLVPDYALVADEHQGFAELRIHGKGSLEFSRGICGLLPATAFTDGTVRPHEQTLTARLERQEKIVLADQGALGKPVLLTTPSLKSWWSEADAAYDRGVECLTFSGQNNDYHLRKYTNTVPGDEGYVLQSTPLDLTELGALVIADGHHRAETHARLSARGETACDFIPVCIIGGDELSIGAFTRIITGASALKDQLPRLAKFFDYEILTEKAAPRREGEWLLVRNDVNYRLIRKASTDGSIDTEWIDQTVLPEVFGITDTRTDKRISFYPTPKPQAGNLVLKTEPETTYLCGFPLPIEKFFKQVQAGRRLPPKSTLFEPRVPSGLVVWKP